MCSSKSMSVSRNANLCVPMNMLSIGAMLFLLGSPPATSPLRYSEPHSQWQTFQESNKQLKVNIKRNKELQDLPIKILSQFCNSSSYMDRLFSIMGVVATKRRTCLGTEQNKLLNIYGNA